MQLHHTLTTMFLGLATACAAAAPGDDANQGKATSTATTASTSHAYLTLAGTPAPEPAAGAATLGPAGEGRRLYLKLNCYSCHGMSAEGGMGPKVKGADQGDVSEVLRQGAGEGMPSYKSYVTTTDISNITAYLRSIGTASEPKFRDWWVDVPPK
jgi:mono/diheme cytochrome c family protein